MGLLRWLVVLAVPVWAQLPTCTVPTWSACDLAFDLEAGEIPASVQLHGEFRSACPFCRCDHVYRTKDVFMRAAIHRRDYISDLFSAEV